jgi:hypothetical protein
MMKKLFIAQMILFIANFALAETFDFHFDDPVSDHTGIVDVVSMDFTFDDVTGDYAILLTADPVNPFVGNFRININLFNPDTGTTAYDTSSFHDTMNDYDLSSPVLTIELTGTRPCLTQWKEGDRVATSDEPFGNPDYASGFISAVTDLPYEDPYNGDYIASGEFTFIGFPSAIPPGGGETLYVPGDYPTLRTAILAAKSGDHIEVAPGTYYERINFDGKALHLYSSAGPAVTTIHGGGTGVVVYCNSSVESNTILEGFTITGGPYRPVGGGGGMYNFYGNPRVVNCVFTGNSSYDGAGMYNRGGSPLVVKCTFTDNSAPYIYGEGGGIYNYNASPTIIGCTFSSNSATYRGGGICNFFSNATIANCTFEDNTATNGGGIYNFSSNATITNSAFEGNTATDGGGMYNGSSTTNVTNCTLTGNLAGSGGGMCNAVSSTLTMANCIVWANNSDNIYGPATISYSLIEGGWPGEGNIDADPLFQNPDIEDYHIMPNSPCNNAGDPNGEYTGQTDMDGEPRVINGRVDIGVDECSEPPMGPIEEIFLYIVVCVEDETLAGEGLGNSGEKRLNALTDMLEEAQSLIEAELYEEALEQLESVYKHVDGESPPKDFVKGEAAANLAAMIQDLMENILEVM